MTEILLNAVLNLFALQAVLLGAESRAKARSILAEYLSGHLRIAQAEDYLELFDATLEFQAEADAGQLPERVREVAAKVASLMPRLEQHVLLLRCLELAVAAGDSTPPFAPALAPAHLVAEELSVGDAEFQDLLLFCRQPFASAFLSERFLLAGNVGSTPDANQPDVNPPKAIPADAPCHTLARPSFQGRICVLRIPDAEVAFLVTDSPDLSLSSLPLPPGARVLLQPGAIVRDGRGNRIYQAELEAAFRRSRSGGELEFRGESLQFRYPGSDIGLHDFSFCEQGGRMVGIMGVSGAGKSTLLTLLNGQLAPDSGRVTVNGADLHKDAAKLEGVIGFVPQDDLLFEDLTVFENLYYNASLCLANLSASERAQRVDALLEELHQPAIRNLKVGSPLDKTISGGQRKRLNIALELIREPSILFVDEPTSGLSSSDSENVMALLKAQAAKGKLVLVVIHQPSSRIYKMFDTLWVLDQGGKPIFDGNPLDAIVHFRTAVHQAGMDEYACPHCGSVNPEQLFEIIEARDVDEHGQYTRKRRVSALEWHERYLKVRQRRTDLAPGAATQGASLAPPERRLWRPGSLGQLGVFFLRTLKGRLANGQYLAINLIEPPLLALLAALISRGAWGGEYVFGQNENLGTYFFISVVVALFMGLSVSAEEINRDRKILKRERFLHLSWPSYVASKALYLGIMAALQTAMFTLVGNTILNIPDMYAFTWLTLFSCAVCSSILGLNISAAFRSAVTIYILIPLILVPQMMLGGAVVSFDELIHRAAGTRSTPLVADLMPSRWGYEALVVEQYVENRYMRRIFEDRCTSIQADYMTEFHIAEMRALADFPLLEEGRADLVEAARRLRALHNEIELLERRTGLRAGIAAKALALASYDAEVKAVVKEFLGTAEAEFRRRGKAASDRVLASDDALREALGREGFEAFKDRHYNKDIAGLALNSLNFEPVRLSGERLVQLAAPVCQPVEQSFGAHFLAAFKRIGFWTLPTQLVDLAVLWFMSATLYVSLYFSLLPRLLALGERLCGRK